MTTNTELSTVLAVLIERSDESDKKVDQIIIGQETNAKEHREIMVTLGRSDERWKAQFGTNKELRSGIGVVADKMDNLKTTDKVLGGIAVVLAAIAGIFGWSN